MNDRPSTYPIKRLLGAVVAYELIADLLFLAWLLYIGFFNPMDGENDFFFQKPIFLTGIPFLFLSYLAFLWLLHWKNKHLEQVANPRILTYLYQREKSGKLLLLFIAFRNTLFFLLVALSQPIYGSQTVRNNQLQGEAVLVLDISNSMNTRDLDSVQSRLEIAKRSMQQFINQTSASRVGVVVFAGSSYVQLALTSDFEAAKMFITEIQTDLISQQGTNIRSALETASTLFTKGMINKHLLLITDGENHEGKLNDIILKIKEEKIQLGIIGIGTETGGLIPNDIRKPYLGYKVDERGEHVISQLNPQLIRALAKESKGISIVANNAFPDIQPILDQFQMEKQVQKSTNSLQVKRSFYSVFVLIALAHFIVYVLVRSQPNHVFGKKPSIRPFN